MASTGAVLYIKPTVTLGVAPGHHTGAVIYVPFREVSGIFSATGVSASANLSNLRSFLPHSRQPVDSAGNLMDPSWYRFFQMFVDVFLGGVGSLTIADIVSAVTVSQENTTALSSLTQQIASQNLTNAAALSVVAQVARDNSLTGATQIPPVQLNYTDIP
jgi:hypothetical protein